MPISLFKPPPDNAPRHALNRWTLACVLEDTPRGIWDNYADEWRGFMKRLGDERALDIEGVVTNTYLKARQSQASYKGEISPRNYLFMLMRSCRADAYQKQKRAGMLASSDTRSGAESAAPSSDDSATQKSALDAGERSNLPMEETIRDNSANTEANVVWTDEIRRYNDGLDEVHRRVAENRPNDAIIFARLCDATSGNGDTEQSRVYQTISEETGIAINQVPVYVGRTRKRALNEVAGNDGVAAKHQLPLGTFYCYVHNRLTLQYARLLGANKEQNHES